MRLDKNWRVLTVGDGDLSFSYSLLVEHGIQLLTASIYDDEQTLSNKYQSHYLDALETHQIDVLTGFDIENPQSWGELSLNSFDVVIFQFPLITASAAAKIYMGEEKGSVNLLNRRLLRQFLLHAHEYWLSEQGERLCFITSKAVKPYIEWNIEGSLSANTEISYLGKMPFEQSQFPSYQVRNVDRDKSVKSTQAMTYVWSDRPRVLFDPEFIPPSSPQNRCLMCQAGPFKTLAERIGHESASKHQRMLAFEQDWLAYLAQEDQKENPHE